MKKMLALLAVALLAMPSAWAGPQILNYQGSLIGPAGASVPDGTYRMRFRLYAAQSGGSNLWSEVDSSVEVKDGLFSTILGDGTAFGTVFDNDTLYLEIAVDTSKNSAIESSEIFAPRQRMTSAAWAVNSDELGGRAASDFASRQYDAVVAPSGGDFTTLQAALAAGRNTIYIRKGTYTFDSDAVIAQDGVRIIGESREGVILDCGSTTASLKAVGGGEVMGILGSTTLTDGSPILVGMGTNWETLVSAGQYALLNDSWFLVESVDSDTQITLANPYHGPTLSGGGLFASMLQGIEIENLTIRGGAADESHALIRVEWALDVAIRNCDLLDCHGSGVYMSLCGPSRVEGNTCTGNKYGLNLYYPYATIVTGNSCSKNSDSGIVFSARGSTLANNVCANNGSHGLSIGGVNNAISSNVSRSNAGHGIVSSSSPCSIGNNQCEFNMQSGIYIQSASLCSLTGNTCRFNSGSGISLYQGNLCAVSANTCSGNGLDGIYLEAAQRNSIVANTCASNVRYGANFSDLFCDDNTCGMNTLVSNTTANLNVNSEATVYQTATNYAP